jgi:LmbE family N-acetylglucosaminyl deacetylase
MRRPQPTADLAYRLRSLGNAGAVLHLGAHPDDEDSGTLAYLSRRHAVRTVYWSATRGEGGQNRRGPESGEALGILRTWETLAARELDGAEALYGPFYDFGFSKQGDDTLARWGRERVVREIVRAIRLVQPLIVISRWSGEAREGHGHHQAIGLVAEEAFAAAADRARFPELLDDGLPPWQARKLYRSLGPDWQPGEGVTTGAAEAEYEGGEYLRLDTGETDPLIGLTYQEQADLARNCHRSQGMGLVPDPGPYFYYYRLDLSLTPSGTRDLGFFEGLDPTLTGLAEHLDAPSALRDMLAEVVRHAATAAAAFRPGETEKAGLAVLEGLRVLRELREALDRGTLEPEPRAALDRYAARKARDFEGAAASCFGLRLECQLDRAHTSPGRTVRARVRAWSTGARPIDVADARLDVPDGWGIRTLPRADRSTELSPDAAQLEEEYEIEVPDSAPFSPPYWLREPRGPFSYLWPTSGGLGLPFDPPLVGCVLDADIDGHRVRVRTDAVQQSPFAGGFRQLPLAVLPPIAMGPQSRRELVPSASGDLTIELAVTLRSLENPEEGTLALLAPAGFGVVPAAIEVGFAHGGESQTVRFEVTIPKGTDPGAYELRYELATEGRRYGVDVEPVRLGGTGSSGVPDEASCVAEAFLIRPASPQVHVIDANFIRTLRYGYVPGVQEDVLPALARFELDLSVLADEELSFADLADYHAIVVGPNAYVSRSGVRSNAGRLLDYVAGGGTLIVQYQGYSYEAEGLAPYPFGYRRPHDRVTDFDAPVKILEPDHPVLRVPNEIGPEDWSGWVHDRGLYFWGEWDPRYAPLLACHDPGEEPQQGGLLVAGHGRGTYVYVGYSLFRQIPAGVPGGVRLLANLLALAEARVAERTEHLRRVELFAAMPDSELHEMARLMSERWFEDGTYLFREGDRGSELFLLVDGEVEALKGKRVVHTTTPGQAVGELAVLADLPRSATLRARGDATVLVMRGADFRERLRRHPDLSEQVLRYLARKLASPG